LPKRKRNNLTPVPKEKNKGEPLMKKPAEVASGYLSIGRSKVSAPLYKSFILGI
jgi:hypothetical protein